VLSVIDTLKEKGWNITEENIREGMRTVTWPGRFDIVGRDPLFIIDGGHNPQCIEALVVNIRDYLKDQKVIALTGVLADKDYADMYRPVMPLVQEFVCITPPNPRKLDATELAAHLQSVGATATPCATIEDGVRAARELAGQDGVVLCFGSLYTIGSIKEAMDNL
jgi:dihydrofolate synthase/folylpolyglutamate synthase